MLHVCRADLLVFLFFNIVAQKALKLEMQFATLSQADN